MHKKLTPMPSPDDIVKVSKFLSLVLRHAPEKIGLQLDAQGWARVDELLEKLARRGRRVSQELLEEVVAKNDKKRFSFSPDGSLIRANQGHSIVAVDLALEPQLPPALLYHGTAKRNLESIRASGLWAASRNHVHLSADTQTALTVGRRHGQPVVLTVRSGEMAAQGHTFFLSDNGVWLTEAVAPQFIDVSKDTNG